MNKTVSKFDNKDLDEELIPVKEIDQKLIKGKLKSVKVINWVKRSSIDGAILQYSRNNSMFMNIGKSVSISNNSKRHMRFPSQAKIA